MRVLARGRSLPEPGKATVGPDGNLYIAETQFQPGCIYLPRPDCVVRVNPATGRTKRLTPLRRPSAVIAEVGDLVFGPDHQLYVIDGQGPRDHDGEAGLGQVIRVDPTTGRQQRVDPPGGLLFHGVSGAFGADGALYLVTPGVASGDLAAPLDPASNPIVRLDPTTGQETPVADPSGQITVPWFITPAPPTDATAGP
jgi:hypothetical protein